MYNENKKVYLAWSEKGVTYLNSMYAYDTLMNVDQALVKCEEILGEAGIGIGYTSKTEEIDRVLEGRCTLYTYINRLNYYVDEKLDDPLRKDFKVNATETISRIKLENFEVDNTLGITEQCIQYDVNGYAPQKTEREKQKLTFADFIGTSDGSDGKGGVITTNANGSMQEFASIFAGQYEAMLEAGMLGEDNEMTQEEFLEQFYRQGEFTHDSSNPFLNFVSSVLDFTIIKPIIEACTGEDLITGEDLTDLERGLKVVFAVLDLVTLGGAIGATKLSEMSLKEGLQAFGKTVAIDFASNTAACGVSSIGEALDWPVPITMMLSLATGISVSISGNKMLFKNADGITIGSKTLDDEELKIIGETAENTDGIAIGSKTLNDGNVKISGEIAESGSGVKYSPVNPGPLNEEVANSFNAATYTERVLAEDTVMYRVSGGNAKEVGSYMSMTPQGGGLQSQLDLALNPAWGNTTENVTKVVVPKGTTIYEGIAAPQNIYDSLGNVIGTLPGGGNQIYIPEVEVGWFQ